MGFRCCTDEDAGDGGVARDGGQIMSEITSGKEGGKLPVPVGALGTDIFQGDIKVPEDGVERGHAMDAETDEGVGLLRMKEGILKILFLTVMIKPL